MRRLVRHPLSGREVPEIPGRGYRIVFMVVRRRVAVLRVWHGSRHLGGPDAVADEDEQDR